MHCIIVCLHTMLLLQMLPIQIFILSLVTMLLHWDFEVRAYFSKIKYDFVNENEICVLSFQKPAQKKSKVLSSRKKTLIKAYTKPLPISAKKYSHLQYLCKHGVPEIYHNFYKNLPVEENKDENEVLETEIEWIYLLSS